MAGNIFGTVFRYISWGESHGKAIGCVIDGVPPNVSIDAQRIQAQVDRRRPGGKTGVTHRNEADKIEILSGVFKGLSTGTPISVMIKNHDMNPSDYENLADVFRPGHADYTYFKKYGIRDYRGGGRASARETVCRVIAGSIAELILETEWGNRFSIESALISIGPHMIDNAQWESSEIESNPYFCPDRKIVKLWEEYLKQLEKNQDSAGAVVEIRAYHVPPGLGEPVLDKLDADIAKAMMSINAAKGVEVGLGFETARNLGSTSMDQLVPRSNQTAELVPNVAGGILGGISSGSDIVVRVAFKPTSSIGKTIKTVNKDYQETQLNIQGRHDPCVGIRAVPVCKAMMACVLADHWLRFKAQCIPHSIHDNLLHTNNSEPAVS